MSGWRTDGKEQLHLGYQLGAGAIVPEDVSVIR